MNLLRWITGTPPPEPIEPAPFKYAGQSGTSASTDGGTDIKWTWPEWTTADLALCAKGKHEQTRKRLVQGWLGYFTQVDRYYCACGRFTWVWFERGWADTYEDGPNAHERWVDGHLRMEQLHEEAASRV